MEYDSHQLNRTSLGYKVRPCHGPGWAVGEGKTQKPANGYSHKMKTCCYWDGDLRTRKKSPPPLCTGRVDSEFITKTQTMD